ncbi:aspartate/glutamate racemase family protein [Chloroflexota bacterium]
MVREGTTVEVQWLKAGYSEPTYAWTESYNAVEGVKRYYEAWKTGYDGVVIGCMLDPGLVEARSLIDIPVSGALQSSLLIANCLGNKYSVITIHRAIAALQTDKIKRYGLAEKLASIRHTDIRPMEIAALYAKPASLIEMFSELAVKAVREDGAEVIIPGCTCLSTFLTAQNVYEIEKAPIIDPVWAGIKMAEVLVDLKKSYGVVVSRAGIYSAPIQWEKEMPI